MLDMSVIEVIIGLLFIYLLLSLLASIVNEVITGFFSLRGRFLMLSIGKLIDDDNNVLSHSFKQHPFFRKISPPSKFRWFKKVKLPSYLDKTDFTKIFLETLLDQSDGDGFQAVDVTFEKVKAEIEKLKEGETKELLLSLVNEADKVDDKLKELRKELENSYDSLMSRAAGWYKRRIQFFLFLIGLTIAAGFNADTFQITRQLSRNPELRSQIVNMAETFRANADSAGLQEYYEMSVANQMDPDFVAQLKELGDKDSTQVLELYSNYLQLQQLMQEDIASVQSLLGLGSILTLEVPESKQKGWAMIGWVAQKLLGWILTALAISLGAPFWFDMLNKIMKVRSSGKIPKQSD